STNQVLTSWLLATSPRSSASSRRFCVGSSVFSPSCPSSAMRGSPCRRERAQHTLDIAEIDGHHGADDEDQYDEAHQYREREADEEDLHLRHQPREHAEAEVEQQAEDDERCGKLHAEAECGGEGPQ